jgi:cytochrome c oxidase cbb3-type subunit I/II
LETVKIEYDDRAVRRFIGASVVFGIVGMLVGVIVALQLAFWPANFEPFLTFGRLRPLHTNAVIFAFVGNMMFAGIYYSTQRLLKARMGSDVLSAIHFWGWQLIIVAAAVTLPLGLTTGKEYAELEWPIDLAIAVVWVVFAINFFWAMAKRNERHLYVAIWFYIATIITVAVLHIVNSLEIPVGPFKSYSVFGGVQDALVQWWYGHNAVAFFLTTPILGIMYYFLPKAAERPVFSYRLSIIHFWALVFLYIWAGPHHLLYTALPEWAQTLGMVFSVMLLAPSWGGMINGLLTLRGAWDGLRSDPVLKFFAAAVTFYGMSTFEGPLMSIKSVNGLAHYTDWIIGHAHGGALGWNGFMAAGMFYWLVPRLFGTKLRSTSAANFHFWIGTFGILFYMVAMWISGVTQGLMWRATTDTGALQYPNFIETLLAIKAMYWMRLVGGLMYLTGFVLMAWNLWATMRAGKAVTTSIEVTRESARETDPAGVRLLFGTPVLLAGLVIVLLSSIAFLPSVPSAIISAVAVIVGVVGTLRIVRHWGTDKTSWHRIIEGKGAIFTVIVVVAVLIGGVAELVPTVVTGSQALRETKTQPYTALELEGRDVYIREGCYLCHSQMVRAFTWESARYGKVSEADDSIYDHPFQWGSKRTGPDLARLGGRYPDLWHYEHMLDPRQISPGSNMPSYTHLKSGSVDFASTGRKLDAMQVVGVPYTEQQVTSAPRDALAQAQKIVEGLRAQGGVQLAPESELVALIAYLQRLGKPPAAPTAASEASRSATRVASVGGR